MPEIEAQYQKRIGLPGYSSHSFSVSIKTDLADVANVDREASKLYVILQQAVDAQIVESGFLPEAAPENHTNGSDRTRNGNHSNGNRSNGNGSRQNQNYLCSDKQRDLIAKVVQENRLSEDDLEKIAREMFNTGLAELNRMEFAGFVGELLERYPRRSSNGNERGQRSYQRNRR